MAVNLVHRRTVQYGDNATVYSVYESDDATTQADNTIVNFAGGTISLVKPGGGTYSGIRIHEVAMTGAASATNTLAGGWFLWWSPPDSGAMYPFIGITTVGSVNYCAQGGVNHGFIPRVGSTNNVNIRYVPPAAAGSGDRVEIFLKLHFF